MASESRSAGPLEFVTEVERAYQALMATHFADAAVGLGGKLLYAGQLDGLGRTLVVAANIAGAASLAAIADRAAQKQALHDGVADFLVNSLDEALRILKNQLRKREPAAVCVGLEPAAVEDEMRERGVEPDLLRNCITDKPAGEKQEPSSLVTWSVATAPAQWLPKIDAIAMACLPDDAWRARRWLRLSPRYLGRQAQALRLLRCDDSSATRFVQQVHELVMRREIAVAVQMKVRDASGAKEEWRVEPDAVMRMRISSEAE